MMNSSDKQTTTMPIEEVFAKHFKQNQYISDDELFFLVDLVHLFRPKNPNQILAVSIEELVSFLESNLDRKTLLKQYLQKLLQNRKFCRMLSDAGILQDSDFIHEVKKRVFAKFLPNQPQKDTLEYVLNQVFYRSSDAIWVNKIPTSELYLLFDTLCLTHIYISIEDNSVLSEILNAMDLISQRISGRAMESDVIRMVPEYDNLESPFTAFENELYFIESQIKSGDNYFILSENLHFKQLFVLHKQCEEYVDKAFANSAKFGISLKVNQSLLRIKQQLERLKILLPFLVVNNSFEKKKNSIQLGLKLIEYNCHKNNVRRLISESTQLISYEITQHTAKTGEHYITESPKEYFLMLKAALGGGFIVGILCIIKLLLSKMDTSDFGHAFFYSMNYSVGFILIFLFGFTLATKQPAMTASTIIQAIENDRNNSLKKEDKLSAFAQLFARLFRSQFIAFIGNVMMAFPVSFIGIWLIDFLFDYNIAFEKSEKLLNDLSPIHSPAIIHAAIAGVFLFLSGIISGNVSNTNKHNQVYFRIQEHPLLKKAFGISKTIKIAKWFENNWAGIVSNGWFGVFLGSTASVGLFLGLDLDIRHITFASGNFALGIYGANYFVDNWTIFWSILGIGIIGYMNFIVSFSLSLGLAFRSRNIPLAQLKHLFKTTWTHFKKRPMIFFFPLKEK